MPSLCSRCKHGKGKHHICHHPQRVGSEYNLKWSECRLFEQVNLIERLRREGFKPIVNVAKSPLT